MTSALKATRAALARLAEPLDDADIAAAVERPFADLELPDTDSLDTAELSHLLELSASSLAHTPTGAGGGETGAGGTSSKWRFTAGLPWACERARAARRSPSPLRS